MRTLIQLSLLAFLLLGVSVPVLAAPATHLLVNCIPEILPPPDTSCFNHVVGQPFGFWAVALDAGGQLATGYAGTVQITSDDPMAALPPDHTFTAADGSLFQFGFTFNSVTSESIPSPQTITATDAANALSGTGTFFVSPAPPPTATPGLNDFSLMMLAGLLGCAGAISVYRFCRSR